MNLPQCPVCQKDYVQRVPRLGLGERLLSLFYVYPFRCQICTHRFLARQPGVRYTKVEEDRRDYERIAVRYPVAWSGGGAGSKAIVTDLSVAGCTIETDVRLPVGTIVQLQVEASAGASAITVAAALVHTARANALGMEFLRFKDEERKRLQQLVHGLLGSR